MLTISSVEEAIHSRDTRPPNFVKTLTNQHPDLADTAPKDRCCASALRHDLKDELRPGSVGGATPDGHPQAEARCQWEGCPDQRAASRIAESALVRFGLTSVSI